MGVSVGWETAVAVTSSPSDNKVVSEDDGASWHAPNTSQEAVIKRRSLKNLKANLFIDTRDYNTLNKDTLGQDKQNQRRNNSHHCPCLNQLWLRTINPIKR